LADWVGGASALLESLVGAIGRYVFGASKLHGGRKNWLFAGSDDGGERAAAIYTLLGTAKLNDLNPESYLRYVLERIADHPINKIEELLPWNLLLKMPELRIAA
jgi:hypothetical protein